MRDGSRSQLGPTPPASSVRRNRAATSASTRNVSAPALDALAHRTNREGVTGLTEQCRELADPVPIGGPKPTFLVAAVPGIAHQLAPVGTGQTGATHESVDAAPASTEWREADRIGVEPAPQSTNQIPLTRDWLGRVTRLTVSRRCTTDSGRAIHGRVTPQPLATRRPHEFSEPGRAGLAETYPQLAATSFLVAPDVGRTVVREAETLPVTRCPHVLDGGATPLLAALQ